MKTAQEIFTRHFNKSVTISSQADFEKLVILPAMEEYALYMAEQAFNAARQTNGSSQIFLFGSFADYQSGLQQPPADSQRELRQSIEDTADMILPQYIPADTSADELTFSFKAAGTEYQVWYRKGGQGFWQFSRFVSV